MKIYILLLLCLMPILSGQLFGEQAGSDTSLVLVDESLQQTFVVLEHLTNKPVLYDQNMPNIRINLNIPNRLPKSDIIRALEGVLSMNGVAIIDRGDGFLRAVSTRSVGNQSPELIEDSVLERPLSDKVYAKLFVLRHIFVGEFAKLVRQILSPSSATVIPFEESNSLLITDRLSNLQRLEALINLVDKPRLSRIESKIFRIKHGDAKNISTVLKKLISEKSFDSSFDRQQDAGQITTNQNSSHVPLMHEESLGTGAGDFKLSRYVSIECDEYSNSVIVCGSSQDIQQIGHIIEELDVLLNQVRIEVVIAQVTLSDAQTSGLETLGITYNSVTDTSGNIKLSGDNQISFSGQGASNNRVDSGFHVGGTLNNFSLSYVFNKARSCDNIAVLSAPTIVTTHNREASVKVGESRPVITANFTDLQNQRSIRNSVSYKDIGIELVVTPLIGQNGIIQMKIDQLIQKINGEITVDGNKQPIISKRQAVSFVSVHDGDVVVLAGLQEKESIDSRGKLWLFGYLPVVGNLFFSPKVKSEQTNELIIFIRPTIITNPSSQDEYYDKFLSNTSVKEEIISYEEDKKFLKQSGKKSDAIKHRMYNSNRRRMRK